jgi:hypothetical protein
MQPPGGLDRAGAQEVVDAFSREVARLLDAGEVRRLLALPEDDMERKNPLTELILGQRPRRALALDVHPRVAPGHDETVPPTEAFVGFWNAETSRQIRVDVTVGGQVDFVHTLSIPPGAIGYALRGCWPFMTIAMRFHEVRYAVRPEGARYATVGAMVESSEWSRVLATSLHVAQEADGGGVTTGSGVVRFHPRDCGEDLFELASRIAHDQQPVVRLPDLSELARAAEEGRSRERSVARCRAVLEDLVRAAWHPRRLRVWCLTRDDEFAAHERDAELEAPVVLEGFLSRDEVASVVAELGVDSCGARCSVELVPDPPTNVAARLIERLRAVTRDGRWSLPRPGRMQLTAGDSSAGLGLHRDESLQGGTHSLLVYVDSPRGGETVFYDALGSEEVARVRSVAGRAVLFGVRVEHRACRTEDRKRVVALEVLRA